MPPGFLIFGMIARNTFGDFMNYFPYLFAQYVRLSVFCILLARLAIEFRFADIGCIILWILVLLPSSLEMIVSSSLARGLFGMDIKLSFALGFLMASAGTTTIISANMALRGRKIPFRKNIQLLILLACTLDNLVNETLNSILTDLYLNEINDTTGEPNTKSFFKALGISLAFIVGVALSFLILIQIIKRIRNQKVKKGIYFIIILALAILIPWVSSNAFYGGGKYFSMVMATYWISRISEHNNP